MANDTKRIAIVGGGIVGATAAFYLSKSKHHVSVFDDGIGQATSASAGIISPWLSQRRNKVWYRLAANGAAFYKTLLSDLKALHVPTTFYRQNGTIVFKNKDNVLDKLEQIANERLIEDKMIGQLRQLSIDDITEIVPECTPRHNGLFASGGAVIDGKQYVQTLLQAAQLFSCRIVKEKVTLSQLQSYDIVVLACGAWLGDLLSPLGYTVDVRPQKGQLFEINLPNKQTAHYPVFMPQSEIDLLPFEQGKWVIGATHENDQGFDLTPDERLLQQMKDEASLWLPDINNAQITNCRVGTRAYTSDFTPFFGKVPNMDNVYVTSGLGSSGLTTGPYIAYLLAQLINQQPVDIDVTLYSPNKYIIK